MEHGRGNEQPAPSGGAGRERGAVGVADGLVAVVADHSGSAEAAAPAVQAPGEAVDAGERVGFCGLGVDLQQKWADLDGLVRAVMLWVESSSAVTGGTPGR